MLRVFVAIFCLSALGAATQPDSVKPGDIVAEAQAEIRQRLGAQWAPFAEVPAKDLTDIVRLGMKNDWLVASSPVYGGSSVNNRVAISDVNGVGDLRLTASRFPGAYYIFFEFHDFSQPGLVERQISLLSAPVTLQLDQDDVFSDSSSMTVSLEETVDPGAEAPITLRVQHPNSNEAFLGTSLSDLRRKYPDEFERYLRPLMRNFEAEPVGFRVDDKTAWQVLSDTWRAPADLPGKVEAIVGQLNADDYVSRAAAQKELDQMGEPAALYLMSSTRADLSPEQTARLAKFLASYRPLSDGQVGRFRSDVNFLLDCLYSDDSAVRGAALGHLHALTGHELQMETDEPAEGRIASIRRLRDQIAPISSTEPSGN